MLTHEFDLFDASRQRRVPVLVQLPDEVSSVNMPTVVYSPGYGGGQQKFLQYEQGIGVWPYKDQAYLAKFFTDRGYAFVSIQHDIVGDSDGLETLDPNAVQSVVRRPLWERGVMNMLFVLDALRKKQLGLNLEQFVYLLFHQCKPIN